MALNTRFNGIRGWIYKTALVCVSLVIATYFYSLISSVSLADDPLIISSGAEREARTSGFTVSYQSLDCIDNELNHGDSIDINGELRVSVWNIYKQNNSGWQSELTEYMLGSQLTLLQEVKWSSDLIKMITDYDSKFVMVRAFNLDNALFGVMSLSKIKPSKACAYLEAEPMIRFPKSALSSIYPLSNGQQLLVINQHSINFELDIESYQAQLAQVESLLAEHNGPVIFAGDFNTWSDERVLLVHNFAHKYNLTAVTFKPDRRTKVLGNQIDHIYYRQLNLIESQADISNGSDHHPMSAKFSLNPAY